MTADMSPAQQVIQAITVLWPREKVSPEKAESLIRRASKVGDVAAFLQGISDSFTEDPDQQHFSWRAVEHAMHERRRIGKSAGKATAKHNDDMDWMRDRYRPYAKTLLWVAELLDYECANPGVVQDTDLRNWDEAYRLKQDYDFYEIGLMFTKPPGRWWKANPWAPAGSLGRVRRIERVHTLYTRATNLRTFGERTEHARDEWRSAMRAEARIGGIDLPADNYPEDWT